jgi:exopolysaccharide production protein ExoF
MATGDIRTQSARLNRLIAREARLSAAFDGREDIPLTPELAKLKDDPETSAIVKNEQDALALENEVKRGEITALESIKLLYEQEIETLHGHDQALAQEHDSIATQLKELRGMAARGLALAPTMFSLERSLAQVASQQMATETAVVKAKEGIALAQQRVTDLQQERRRLVAKELDKTRDEIAEARTKIVTATQLLHEAQTSAPAEARERTSQDREQPSFTILRKGDDETIREVAADEKTLVVPGDVIKVPRVRLPPVDVSAGDNLSRAASLDR